MNKELVKITLDQAKHFFDGGIVVWTDESEPTAGEYLRHPIHRDYGESESDLETGQQLYVEAWAMEQRIDAAREILEEAGYFVSNLWHVEDVRTMVKEDIDDGECMDILEQCVANDWIIEQINVSIDQEVSNSYTTIR